MSNDAKPYTAEEMENWSPCELTSRVKATVDERDRLLLTVEAHVAEQAIHTAFYELAVKERDRHATLLTLYEAERDALRAQRDAAVEALRVVETLAREFVDLCGANEGDAGPCERLLRRALRPAKRGSK